MKILTRRQHKINDVSILLALATGLAFDFVNMAAVKFISLESLNSFDSALSLVRSGLNVD